MQENEDIEKEEINGIDNIKDPFNPNEININIVPRSVGQLVDLLEYDEILIPKFQRRPNLWNNEKKSKFIESLMLGLPIPLFYFDEGSDHKWRIIDGLQRISTLEHFILGTKKNTLAGNKEPLTLQNLEFLSDYNGYSWEMLPRDMRRRILTNTVTVNLIGKGTPEAVKYIIFNRINQGSTSLEAQEIRTALFQGYRTDFLESLVLNNTLEGQAFIKATDGSVTQTRQNDLDFATRFISFYLVDYKKYEPDMDAFLAKGTKEIPDKREKQDEIRKNFRSAMELSLEVFGDKAFRKTLDVTGRNPINKSLFEIVSTNFAKLSDRQRQLLANKRQELIEHFLLLQRNQDFMRSISIATATKASVSLRHEKFNTMINNFLNDI